MLAFLRNSHPFSLKLALKIDVDTLRGTREGVPRLLEILQRHEAGATFFLSFGGRIGRGCADLQRRVRDAGFEVGMRAFDAHKWQSRVARADASWTGWQMALAAQRFREVFGEDPHAHAAAGWRANAHAFRRTQSMGLRYASDTRGDAPFIPVVQAEIVCCPQFPTTLPTLEELLGRDGAIDSNVDEALLARTAAERREHVFTARAEIEGGKLAPAFERLLEGWRLQGYRLVPLGKMVSDTNLSRLPLHAVVEARMPGRAAPVAWRGAEFLAGESSQ